jgi:hypothetical protein
MTRIADSMTTSQMQAYRRVDSPLRQWFSQRPLSSITNASAVPTTWPRHDSYRAVNGAKMSQCPKTPINRQ